jgi:diguanylate cyclase (GGDEF)-like protein/PAS domain S-box-containing protein
LRLALVAELWRAAAALTCADAAYMAAAFVPGDPPMVLTRSARGRTRAARSGAGPPRIAGSDLGRDADDGGVLRRSDATSVPDQPLATLRSTGELAVLALAALPELSVVVFDRELRVVLSAGAALSARGGALDELEGRQVSELLPGPLLERIEPAYRAALDGRRTTFTHESSDPARAYDLQVAPIELRGDVIGGLVICRDITEQRRTESALALSEQQYRDLAEHSSDVVSRTDTEAVYRYISPSCAHIYGWPPEEIVGLPVTDFCHPDDLAAHASLRARLAAGAPEQVSETRMRRADGDWVWMEMRYSALRDADGRFQGVQAAARDITDRKAAEAARTVADEQFRTAFDGAAIGMALVAPDGAVLRVNDELCAIVGYSRGELLAKRFQDMTHPDDLAADVEYREAVLHGRRSSYQMEKRCLRADGSIVWTSLSVSLVRGPAGRPLHFVSQVQDISQRKGMEAELRALATHDDLTGLHNRRFFEGELVQQLRRTRRHGEEAAVLLLDLDDFKQVNDTLGHHAGDQLLAHVATLLKTRLRGSDVVARLGGDEFAVLLPHAGTARAVEVAASLEGELQRNPIVVDGIAIVARASIGVAALGPELQAEDALRAADHAMYRAKRARRALPPV